MADFYLYPRSPFDFSLSASIFAGGDPQIRTYEHTVFRQVLNILDNPVLTEVFSEGSVDEPVLRISPHADNPLPESAIKDIGNIISSIFNINDDITPFYRAVEGDEVMAVLTHRLRGLKPPTTPTVFEALVDSVIEQQISLKAAHSIENRLIRSVGKSLIIEKNTCYSYPTPHILAHISDSTFRSCGLTIRKGEYIREISQSILPGTLDLDRFKTYPDTESIISEMVKIRGVGRWTADSPFFGDYIVLTRSLPMILACDGSYHNFTGTVRRPHLRRQGQLQSDGETGKDLPHFISKSQTCSGSFLKKLQKI